MRSYADSWVDLGRGVGLQPVRFPRPPTEPDVPVPGHSALHGFMPMGLGWVWLLTMAMRCVPGSGSG